MGRLEEALATKRALELDPVPPYVAQGIADVLYTLRRYDASIEQSQKVLALDPNFGMTRQALGMTYVRRGKYSQGVSELKFARQLMSDNPWADSQLGYAYAVAGQRELASQILNELLEQSKRGPFPDRASVCSDGPDVDDHFGFVFWIGEVFTELSCPSQLWIVRRPFPSPRSRT